MGPVAGRAGSVASWALIGVLGLALAAQPLGCGPGEEILDDTVGDMLSDVGPKVVQPALDQAHASAVALEAASSAWASASTDEASEAKRAAQDAWRVAMADWQVVEPMQVGPLADSDEPGGQDGRVSIYSWPPGNACRVDQETVRGEFGADGWAQGVLVNVKGLDALEHLLFSGEDHDCAAQIGLDDDWDSLGAAGVQAARADYAAALAAGVVSDIEAQRVAWADFAGVLAAAGVDSPVFDRQDEALNAVYTALFYVETSTKDVKLAKPLGLRDCTDERCTDAVEHRLSGQSLAAVQANLDGFEWLFTGGDGVGLDDVLRDRGHGDVVEEIEAGLSDARAAADALQAPIDDGILDQVSDVEALHTGTKRIADAMKGDVATVLSLQIPAEAAGDND